MGRVILIAGLLALALATGAQAQDGGPTPVSTPPPGCERGQGTDADYAYCPDPVCPQGTDADYVYSDECCRRDGTDADYVYADGCPSNTAQPFAPTRRKAGPAPAAAQPLAAGTLPVTGGEPLAVALLGLGLLLCGAGLRQRHPAT